MSGTFPTTPAPATLSITALRKNFNDSSHSGARQVRQITGGHKWRVKATWVNLSVAQMAPIFGFIARQRGSFEKFYFNIHAAGWPAAQGPATGSPLVKQASQTGFSLQTDGWTVSQTPILKAGDFFNWSTTPTKLHIINQDVNSDSAGTALLLIDPEIFVTPPDNEIINISNVLIQVEIADVFTVPLQAPQFSNLTLTMDEVTN